MAKISAKKEKKEEKASSQATRPASPEKYEYAEMLFMRRVPQKEIAAKVGITEPTLSRWIRDNQWRERRAATSVNRSTIINGILSRIDDILTKNPEGGSSKEILQLSKVVEQLDKEITVVDLIDSFIAFGLWLEAHGEMAQEIEQTLKEGDDARYSFIKCVNMLQDRFVNERLKGKA